MLMYKVLHSLFLSQQNIWASDFMPDSVSGIGIIEINRKACAFQQLTLVQKVDMETKIYYYR